MSVLVKGMEMPKSCYDCQVECEDDICGITKGGCTWDERPPHCPLIELPPHGRLIDADALKPYMLNEHYKYRLVYDADEVANAPTIIEAEGRE